MATCPSGHESTDDEFCDVCGFAIGPAGVPGTFPAGVFVAAPNGVSSVGPTVVAVPCPQCGAPRAGQFCESCGYDFTDQAAAAGGGLAGDGGGASPATKLDLPPVPPAPFVPPVTPAPAVSPAPPTSPPSSPARPVPAPPPAPAPPASAPAAPAGVAWTAVVTADRGYYDSVQVSSGPGAADISFPVYCPQRRFPLAGAEIRVGRRSAHSGIEPEIDLTGPPADPGVSRLHAVLLRADDGSWSVVDPGSANGTMVNGAEIARDQLVPLHDGDRIHLGAWTELRIVSEG